MPNFQSYLYIAGGVVDSTHTCNCGSIAHTKSSAYNDPSVFGSKLFIMLLILMLNIVVDKMLPLEHPLIVQRYQI